jgi:hypothetical protein
VGPGKFPGSTERPVSTLIENERKSILAVQNHFTKQTIASSASQGVPLARSRFRFLGVVAIAGGLSILLSYRAKLGAWLIVPFLIPVMQPRIKAEWITPSAATAPLRKHSRSSREP